MPETELSRRPWGTEWFVTPAARPSGRIAEHGPGQGSAQEAARPAPHFLPTPLAPPRAGHWELHRTPKQPKSSSTGWDAAQPLIHEDASRHRGSTFTPEEKFPPTPCPQNSACGAKRETKRG